MAHTFGALKIARVVLLWRRYFKESPLFRQITSLLLERGSSQEGWFQGGANDLHLEESFTRLHIADTESAVFSNSVKRSSNQPAIQHLNMRAIELITAALSSFELEERNSRDEQADAVDPKCSPELAQITESHTSIFTSLSETHQRLTLWTPCKSGDSSLNATF
jgi:hypothetical protein